jgi:hypothetical protein
LFALRRSWQAKESAGYSSALIVWCCDDATNVVEGVNRAFGARSHDAEDALKSAGPGLIAVSTEDLAARDGPSNGQIGWPAGCFDPRFREEREELVPVVAKVICERAVAGIAEPPVQELLRVLSANVCDRANRGGVTSGRSARRNGHVRTQRSCSGRGAPTLR